MRQAYVAVETYEVNEYGSSDCRDNGWYRFGRRVVDASNHGFMARSEQVRNNTEDDDSKD